MARWDDLHRAIEARDPEGAEAVWMELLETDLEAVDRFVDASRLLAKQPGGRRESGILLWMLAEALKEKGLWKELIAAYVELAGLAPDDGSVRNGLIEATRQAYPGRPDLDALLEKSGVAGGANEAFAQQAQTLASYLLLEPGTYVFHKSGWGVGRIVDYLPERERCVIDFKGKPGHEMDIDAAANRLERLAADDIRAMALSDPKRLRKWASEEPLVMIQQVLQRFSGSTTARSVSARRRLLPVSRMSLSDPASPRNTPVPAVALQPWIQTSLTPSAEITGMAGVDGCALKPVTSMSWESFITSGTLRQLRSMDSRRISWQCSR